MKFENHCKKSFELFNEDGAQFHRWIDQYTKSFSYNHREILHNREGVEIGCQLFGECARRHLEQHIRDDYDREDIPTIEELNLGKMQLRGDVLGDIKLEENSVLIFERWLMNNYGSKCPDYEEKCVLCRIWETWERLKKEL